MTFAAVLQRNRGLGPGFDFLRLALALSVVLFHSFQLTYGRSWSAGIFEPAVLLIVPAFFALSGFLVAGSMVRVRSVRTFIAFRALRIAPALAVEITLSALILGPLVTTLSLAGYVSDPQFAIYFTNVLGWIHYHLPGVFLGNPLGGIVNGQLWTVPSELHCYILLAVLMVLRIATRPVLMLAVFVVLASAESATALLPGHHYDVRVLNSQEMLVLCFLCGNVFFLWRKKNPGEPVALPGFCADVRWCLLSRPLTELSGRRDRGYILHYLFGHAAHSAGSGFDGRRLLLWCLPLLVCAAASGGLGASQSASLVGQLRDRGAACADCCGALVACGRKAEPLVA